MPVSLRNEKIVGEFCLPCCSFEAVWFKLKRWKFDGEHYWEVGQKECLQGKIEKMKESGLNIVKTYTLIDNPYHWFVVANPIK